MKNLLPMQRKRILGLSNVISLLIALDTAAVVRGDSTNITTITAAITSTPETSWVPGIVYANSSSIAWLSHHANPSKIGSTAANRTKSPTSRALHDNRLDGSIFDYGEYVDHGTGDDYKATAFAPNEVQTVIGPGGSSQHFHEVLKPSASYLSGGGSGSHSLSNLQTFAHFSYPSYVHTGGGSSGGYHYTAPQYLPPLLPPSSQYLPLLSQNVVGTFEHHVAVNGTGIGTVGGQSEINSKNQLFVQPGKCSNSIEVGRVRDVEVRTVLKYSMETQKGVCVLMLYATNELNKLAISLQAVQGTTNVIPTGTWLETNVKMYAVQGGNIQSIFTKSNFGSNSPALILTRSNIVILSFYVDRPIDFFLNIGTYQSITC